jgi:hypothetical protein
VATGADRDLLAGRGGRADGPDDILLACGQHDLVWEARRLALIPHSIEARGLVSCPAT